MKKAKKWVLPLCLVLLLIIASVFYVKSIVSQAETIPSDTIQDQLEMMYNGKVNELELKNDIYEASLGREGSVYSIRVDGSTGKVLTVELEQAAEKKVATQEKLEEEKPKEPAVQPEPEAKPSPKPSPVEPKPAPKPEPAPAPEQKPQPKPQPKPKPKPQQPVQQKPAPQKTVLLTQQQAIQIALRQLNGKVDDVEFVSTAQGGYSLIEIEIDVEDGPDEATYQIHAISGKVMSVTWDD